MSGWRPLFDVATSRADALQHGCAFIGAEAPIISKVKSGPTSAARGDSRQPCFGQCVLSRRKSLRHHPGLRPAPGTCWPGTWRSAPAPVRARGADAIPFSNGKAAFLGYVQQAPTVRQRTRRRLRANMAPADDLRFLLTQLVDFLNVPPGALVRPRSAGICPQAALSARRLPSAGLQRRPGAGGVVPPSSFCPGSGAWRWTSAPGGVGRDLVADVEKDEGRRPLPPTRMELMATISALEASKPCRGRSLTRPADMSTPGHHRWIRLKKNGWHRRQAGRKCHGLARLGRYALQHPCAGILGVRRTARAGAPDQLARGKAYACWLKGRRSLFSVGEGVATSCRMSCYRMGRLIRPGATVRSTLSRKERKDAAT